MSRVNAIRFASDAFDRESSRQSQLIADRQPFVVRTLRGTEGISQLFRWELELVSLQTDLDIDQLMQHEATIGIRQSVQLAGSDGRARGTRMILIHGMVSTASQTDLEGQAAVYRVEVVPRLWRLTRTVRSRVWVQVDIRAIIQTTLTDAGLVEGVDFDFALAGDYPVRDYVVQYEESDHAFLARWMEHEGLFWFFEHHEKGEKLVISDSTAGYGRLQGAETLTYNAAAGGGRGGAENRTSDDIGEDFFAEELVYSLTREQGTLPERLQLKDYNWRNPRDPLTVETAVNGATAVGHVREYNGHFRTEGEGRQLAQVRADEVRCREVVFRGRSDCRSMQPGATFQLSGHFRADHNIELVVTGVQHEARQLVSADTGNIGEVEYSNTFTAIPSDRTYRPQRSTPWPLIHGVMHAHIAGAPGMQYADVDDNGAYLVTLPLDEARTDKTNQPAGAVSRRVRMAQPYTGAGVGFQFPLRPGVEVLIAHVDGNPDRPVIVGSVPNADNPAIVRGYDNASNIIRTATGQTLRFNDAAGRQGMVMGNSGATIQLHNSPTVNGMIVANGSGVEGTSGTTRPHRTYGPGGSGGSGGGNGSAARTPHMPPSTDTSTHATTAGSGITGTSAAGGPPLSSRVGLFSGALADAHHADLTGPVGGAPPGTFLALSGSLGSGYVTELPSDRSQWKTPIVSEAGFFHGIDDPAWDTDIDQSAYAGTFTDSLADADYASDGDYPFTTIAAGTASTKNNHTWYTDRHGRQIAIDGIPVFDKELRTVSRTASGVTLHHLQVKVGSNWTDATDAGGRPITWPAAANPDLKKNQAPCWWSDGSGNPIRVDGEVRYDDQLKSVASGGKWHLQTAAAGSASFEDVKNAAGTVVEFTYDPAPRLTAPWWEYTADGDTITIRVEGQVISDPDVEATESITGYRLQTRTGRSGEWIDVKDNAGTVVTFATDPGLTAGTGPLWLTSAGTDFLVNGARPTDDKLQVVADPNNAGKFLLQKGDGSGGWTDVQTLNSDPGIYKVERWWKKSNHDVLRIDNQVVTLDQLQVTPTRIWTLRRKSTAGAWHNLLDSAGQATTWAADPGLRLFTPSATHGSGMRAQEIFHGRMAKVMPGKWSWFSDEFFQGGKAEDLVKPEVERRNKERNASTPGSAGLALTTHQATNAFNTVDAVRTGATRFSGSEGNTYKFSTGTTVSVSEGYSGSFSFGDSKSIKVSDSTQSYSNTYDSLSVSVTEGTSQSISHVAHKKSHSATGTSRSISSTGVAISLSQTGLAAGNAFKAVDVGTSETILSAKASIGLVSFSAAFLQWKYAATRTNWNVSANWGKNVKYDKSKSYTKVGDTYVLSSSLDTVKVKADAGTQTTECEKSHVIRAEKNIYHRATKKATLRGKEEAWVKGTDKVGISSKTIEMYGTDTTIGGNVYLGDPSKPDGQTDLPKSINDIWEWIVYLNG